MTLKSQLVAPVVKPSALVFVVNLQRFQGGNGGIGGIIPSVNPPGIGGNIPLVNPPIPLITEQLHPVDNTSVENRDNSPPSAPEGATPPAPAGADHQEVPSNQGPQRSLGELPSSRSGRRRWKSSRLQALDQKVKHSPINQAFLASSKPRLQRDIATSTMEAEYNALSMAMKDLLPLRTVFETVGRALELSSDITSTFKTTVWEDNMGALQLAQLQPGQYTPRSKHYVVKYH